MTRFRMLVIGFVLIGACFTSCGQNADKQSGESAVTEEAAVNVPGEMTEVPGFRMLIPKGWEKNYFEAGGSLQTYPPNWKYMVQVKKAGYNMSQADVDMNLNGLVDRYKGTAVKTVEMLGMTFKTSTFEANAQLQTMYFALKNGEMISITLMGPDHQTDPTVQAVFKSIELK